MRKTVTVVGNRYPIIPPAAQTITTDGNRKKWDGHRPGK